MLLDWDELVFGREVLPDGRGVLQYAPISDVIQMMPWMWLGMTMNSSSNNST